MCAYEIKECAQLESNKTHESTKPTESILGTTVMSLIASATMVAYILTSCYYAGVGGAAGDTTYV